MLPEFAHPAGFWALVGVPAVLAIHFFQQRSRVFTASTLFLLEPLAPESRGGRTWDRLRSSRALWLQLLAVLLAAWVLVEPRWVRAESAQTVAIVVDASASMAAFRAEAETAVAGLCAERAGRAARTEWLLLTSDPRQPPLYRGGDSRAASVYNVKTLLHPGENTVAVTLTNWNVTAGLNLGVMLRIVDNPPAVEWRRSVFNGLAQIIVQSTRQ